MKLIVFGDSIAAGTYTGKNDWCPLSKAKTFGQIVSEELGFSEFKNYAVNGITYSEKLGNNAEYSVINQEKRAEDCDMLLISAGTNDCGLNVAPGTENDCTDISFSGAVEIVFKAISEKRKNTRVVILTPIIRYDGEVNKINVSLDDYRAILTKKAAKYGFTVIDGKSIKLQKELFNDGLHPDDEGHRLIAEYIIKQLKKA